MPVSIGLLSIGQAGKDDVIPEMTDILGPEVILIERGALDGLSPAELGNLTPEPDDFPLITRLRDMTPVVVGKRKILPLMQRQIHELEKQGVQLIALQCTGHFPPFKSQKPLLFPSRIVFNTVTAILSEGTLAVLVPLEQQKQLARQQWQKTGLEVIVENATPYQDPAQLSGLFSQLKGKNADLLVLDCMGYTREAKELASRITGKPTLLPRTLLADLILELITQK